MKHTLLALALAATLAPSLFACDVDTIPLGLRATPPGTGPTVKFDVNHRPLPEVPLPNDVATFADPTSRTGLRVNVSLVAPTYMESRARADFGSMEGWGTSSPIEVSFQRAEGDDPRLPAIDLDDVIGRMQGDEHDFSNDPFYVVNLSTGIPTFVDVGNGYYPVALRDPWKYMPNDPKAGESNLAFETVEEGAGLPQSQYRPSLDRDFDGVLDHPNTWGKLRPGGIPGVDDLLTWYERETDTLLLRPILPLEEKTVYAVVLTDRLRGPNRQPIRSPFESVHHPTQRNGVALLQDHLRNKALANYYGDIAGTGLDHVAFAWTFTTQPTHEDMTILRDGLYGKGPFARLGSEYPAELAASQVAGPSQSDEEQPAGWQNSTKACTQRAKTPFVLKINDEDVAAAFANFYSQAFGLGPGSLEAIEAATASIDRVIVGTFKTPFFMGDPASTDPDTRFHADFKTGDADVQPDTVQFFLTIPKTKNGAKQTQPFPIAFWGHGVTGHADEILFYAGDFARQGVAMFSYNDPEHGLVFGQSDQLLASGALSVTCTVPFLGAITGGRAHDLDGDGTPDSGGYWWTAHIMHTRDNIRQGILDGMQAVRILRSFDGHVGKQDYTGDGVPDVAGDFDGDGVVDAGGPGVKYFAAGESLGGIMSEIQAGIEPYMIASTPMSGGGALAMDVAVRSYGVTSSVTSQLLGPWIFAVPASERPDRGEKEKEQIASVCGKDQRTLRFLVDDNVENRELEIACLSAAELDAGKTIVVTDVTSGERRCARTGQDGRFVVPIPTSMGDKIDVQVYDAPDVVKSYASCDVFAESPVGRRIQTWEVKAARPFDVTDPDVTKCDDEENGCQQFRDVFYGVGSDLVAPNDGLGLRRQSPELRRIRDLAQAALDPADPINYAPFYMLKPQFDEHGQAVPPHALLSINTVGDNFVQVAAGTTFARAAGAVPFLPPSARARYPEYAMYATPEDLYERFGRRTPMQVLIDDGVVEAIPRFGRTHAGPKCAANYKPSKTCTDDGSIKANDCANALYDADWTSEGGLTYDQPHPDVPLRLGRVATVKVTDDATLAAAWEPRLRGTPFSPDETAWSASAPVVAMLNAYLVPEGQHTWDVGDTCRAWDFATYGNGLMARFVASEGRDLYYLSHPKTHGCLATVSCDFFK